MRILAVAFFLLVSLPPAFAGTLLSMEEAEALFLMNNIEIKGAKTDLKKSEAEITDAKLLPNPDLRYYGEAISNGRSGADQAYTLSQPVDIAGKRKRRVEWAQKRRDAQGFLVDTQIGVLLVQMKQSYYKILLLKEQLKVMENIVQTSEEVENRIAERVRAGDVSEVALMKLAAEKSKFLRIQEGLSAELGAEKKRLALMLNLEQTSFELADMLSYKPLPREVIVATETVVDKRPDMRAQTELVNAASALFSLSKREALPRVSVEGGYKTWADGSGGPVIGLALSLPIFNRNQGRIAFARAEMERQRFNYELLRKSAWTEIEILKQKISYLQGRIAGITSQLETTRDITNIARTAYEEGEAGLIEVLDAVRSERELAMEHNSAVYEHWATVFELERATTTRLSADGGIK